MVEERIHLARIAVVEGLRLDDEITELTQGSKDAIQILVKYENLTEKPYRLGRHGDHGPHVRACDAAYAEPELYHWLLAQTRRDRIQTIVQ